MCRFISLSIGKISPGFMQALLNMHYLKIARYLIHPTGCRWTNGVVVTNHNVPSLLVHFYNTCLCCWYGGKTAVWFDKVCADKKVMKVWLDFVEHPPITETWILLIFFIEFFNDKCTDWKKGGKLLNYVNCIVFLLFSLLITLSCSMIIENGTHI